MLGLIDKLNKTLETTVEPLRNRKRFSFTGMNKSETGTTPTICKERDFGSDNYCPLEF